MQTETRHDPTTDARTVRYVSKWRGGTDGIQHRRIISLTQSWVESPMLGRRVPQWRIVVTNHSTAALGAPTVLGDDIVASYKAAVTVLRRAMQTAIREGWAAQRDMERVPAPVD